MIAAEGEGVWGEYAGGYGDWQRVQLARTLTQEQQREAARRSVPAPSRPENRPVARNGRMSFNEKRELEQLPDRIAALEAEQTALHARMSDPALYQQAPQQVVQIRQRLEALDGEIEAAMLRWEALENRAAGG